MSIITLQNFYLIRHGETEMNALRLCCGGGVDTVLTDAGRKQAGEAAKILEAAPIKPTLIIHSDMSRTRETTAILNRNLDIPVVGDNELREHMLGEWEGKSWDDGLGLMLSGARPVGGESRDEFAARIGSALNRNLYEYQDERIMFVGHGGIFYSIMRLYQRACDVFIQNATLHDFIPEPENHEMPWKINLLEMGPDGIVKDMAAPICPIRALKP